MGYNTCIPYVDSSWNFLPGLHAQESGVAGTAMLSGSRRGFPGRANRMRAWPTSIPMAEQLCQAGRCTGQEEPCRVYQPEAVAAAVAADWHRLEPRPARAFWQ
jgi:hypothetical protein